jgi:chromosomal replication initiation ATPase DnaA
MNDDVKIIFNIAERRTGLTKKEITSRRRHRNIVNAKRMVAVILKRNTKMRLWEIGSVVGGLDHSCISHYLKTHNDLMETEYEFRKMYVDMESEFKSSRDTVEMRLDIKIRERQELNKEIEKLRKLIKIKYS